jgi:hypothetical protein
MKPIIFLSIYIIFFLPFSKAQNTIIPSNVTLDKSGNPMLLGPCNETDLGKDPFSIWYATGFKNYKTDSCFCDSIRPIIGDFTFQIFFGTWCGDSKREVPRMLKVLLQSGINQKDISLVAVSNIDSLYKQSPGHEEKGLNILRVPTLIVRKGGAETGRIVESPIETIEKDLWKVLMNQPYKPNYSTN